MPGWRSLKDAERIAKNSYCLVSSYSASAAGRNPAEEMEIGFMRPGACGAARFDRQGRGHGAATSSKTQLFPIGLAEYSYPCPVASSICSKPWPVAGAVAMMIFQVAP